MLSDTDLDAERVLIELIRRETPQQRLRRTLSMIAITRELSFRTIRRLSPELSEDELRYRIIELYYGSELAEKVRAYVERGHVSD